MIIDFGPSLDFYFMRHSSEGLWHIRCTGARPAECMCGKIRIDGNAWDTTERVNVDSISKKCLALYALEEMSI